MLIAAATAGAAFVSLVAYTVFELVFGPRLLERTSRALPDLVFVYAAAGYLGWRIIPWVIAAAVYTRDAVLVASVFSTVFPALIAAMVALSSFSDSRGETSKALAPWLNIHRKRVGDVASVFGTTSTVLLAALLYSPSTVLVDGILAGAAGGVVAIVLSRAKHGSRP
jgi:hypothetical protein